MSFPNLNARAGVFTNLNAAWAAVLVDELNRAAGVREAIVCPGSRSAPLALACADHPGLRTTSVIDERSAGFIALGIAKQSGRPALVVVTSGTAAAHLFPAVLEASQAGVPLIVLSADRPWELQGWGAPQTLPQTDLFGAHVRASLALPSPEAKAELFIHLRAMVSQAGAKARGARPGPVHVNVPFREPLAPIADGVDLSALPLQGRAGELPFVDFAAPAAPSARLLDQVRQRISQSERGVIVCGPRDADDGLAQALGRLSEDTGYPLLAEASSQVRFVTHSHALGSYDTWLRSERIRGEKPDLVLRFGGGLTSKRLHSWIDGSNAAVALFGENGLLFDPAHHAHWMVEGAPMEACAALLGARQPVAAWQSVFVEAEMRTRAFLQGTMRKGDPLTEPTIAAEVVAALPPGAQLFVASSMPIRDVDAFAQVAAPIRVLANRGANGIDGLLSSALGVALASGKPTVLLTGDLALIHDLGGWVSARRANASLCVVVVNNDGGGIFSFLPVAGTSPHFEPLFGTPHHLTFESVAQLGSATYRSPTSASELRKALGEALVGGRWLIELRTERAKNVTDHEALSRLAVDALESEVRS